jgi:hypothetical protein
MNLPTQAAEEWLSTRVEATRTTLAKAAAAAWTAAIPLLLLWSGLSTANKMLGGVLWVSVTLNLFLLAVVCWHRTENRRRLSDQSKSGDLISDLQHSLMDLMYDYYPQRYTREELEVRSGRKRVEVDTALFSLARRTPKLVGEPKGGLWREGQPHPQGWWLSVTGMSYQEKRRSEQAVGEQPAISTSIS